MFGKTVDHNTMKIALIIPYFGGWPPWMDTYLYTLERNPFIDFIFYADQEPPQRPANVQIHLTSFEEYRRLAGQRLGIDFQPARAYKLCDLKPFYGLIHQEELSGYDFWGWSDIDLIYGDLRRFLTPDLLAAYDLISTLGDRVSGPFCLVRNTDTMRNAALGIQNWREKLRAEENLGLDEWYLSRLFFKPVHYLERIFEGTHRLLPFKTFFWFWHTVIFPAARTALSLRKKRLYLHEMYASPRIYPFAPPLEYHYSDGRITDAHTGKELMYLHFICFKKNLYFKRYYWNEHTTFAVDTARLDRDTLIIDKTGFHLRGGRAGGTAG